MDKFNAFMERTPVPVGTKLNNRRDDASIRDTFMFILKKEGFLSKILFLLKFFSNLKSTQKVLVSADDMLAGLTSIA